ncbi:PH domain-containing protein [Microbacterium sp. USHLN186]|uniref:PH domain-containing protein n=1 Tax=Microbacterium sp. USHLN186 TaxID=3081286 RepID=UPI003016480E
MTSPRSRASRTPAALRNLGGTVLLVICAVIAAVLVVDAALRAGVGEALLVAPWPLLVLWSVHVVGVASRVRLRPGGVFVQNLLRTTFAPWVRVRGIRMGWQLQISLDDGTRIDCLGGPARRRPQRLGPGRTKEDVSGDADDAVAALRKAQQAASTEASDGRIRRGWDLPAIGVLVVLVVWAGIAVLLTR